MDRNQNVRNIAGGKDLNDVFSYEGFEYNECHGRHKRRRWNKHKSLNVNEKLIQNEARSLIFHLVG